MSEGNNATGGGIGLAGAVFLVFLVLKLVGVEPVASWSWLWVFSPLWLSVAVVVVLVAAVFLWVYVAEGIAQWRKRRWNRFCQRVLAEDDER